MSLALKIVLAVVKVILTISILLQSSNSAGCPDPSAEEQNSSSAKRARDTKRFAQPNLNVISFYLSCCHWYLLRWNRNPAAMHTQTLI